MTISRSNTSRCQSVVPHQGRPCIKAVARFGLGVALVWSVALALCLARAGIVATKQDQEHNNNNGNDVVLMGTREPAKDVIDEPSFAVAVSFLQELQSVGGLTHLTVVPRINEIAARHLLMDKAPMLAEPPPIRIQCSDPRYKYALTGGATNTTKFIIDIVPFGFDVDLLEIRLLEYSDLVDMFVIVEQTTNHRGDRKPLLMQTLLESRRFSRFNRSKIHYLVDEISIEVENQTKTERAKRETRPRRRLSAGRRKRNRQRKKLAADAASRAKKEADVAIWQIESSMRKAPMDYLRTRFANLTTKSDALFFVIQNDGDEIVNRHVIAHFKACQDRGNFPMYTPSLVFKRNVAWLQETDDMVHMPIHDESKQYLTNFLWRPGPAFVRLEDAMISGLTSMRLKDQQGSKTMNSTNFGLGAANHFSSPSYLINWILKSMSTSDSVDLRQSMLKQGTNLSHELSDQITRTTESTSSSYAAIERHLFRTKTNGSNRMVHLQSLDADLQAFVIENLPWSVTTEPYRYPWLYSGSLLARELDYENKMCRLVSHPDPSRCSQN